MPPASPSPEYRARLRRVLGITVIILVLAACFILVAPGPLSRPLRIFMAVTDLIAAAVVWLARRQKFGPPER